MVTTKFCGACGVKLNADSTVLQWIQECESRIVTWQERQDKETPETDAKETAKTDAKLAMWRKRKLILEEVHGKDEKIPAISCNNGKKAV